MGLTSRLKQQIELFFLRRWDKRGRYPMWALRFFPYLHWCSGMDDMLVDDPADCFCDLIPEEVKVEARKSWHDRANIPVEKDKYHGL